MAFAAEYKLLQVGRGLFGTAVSPVHPATNAVLSLAFSSRLITVLHNLLHQVSTESKMQFKKFR